MQSVPKIVTERLRATAASAGHPDADVLTAFAERSLSDRERGLVLEHVARCRHCRDVVALALPEIEAAILVPSPARRPGLTWPALRWGFVAAGVVVIVSLGVLQYQRRSAAAPFVAREAPPRQTAAPLPATQPLPEAAPTGAASTDKLAQNKDLFAARSQTVVGGQPSPSPSLAFGRPTGNVRGSTIGGPLTHGPEALQQWQQQSQFHGSQVQGPAVAAAPVAVANQQVGTAGKVPAVSETVTVEVQGQVPEVQAETSQFDTLAQGQAAQSQAAPAQPSSGDEVVGKAKLPVAEDASAATAAAGPVAASNGRNFSQLITLTPAAAPLWTITTAGGLQRSLDQGKTWQDIDVNAAPTLADNATSLEVVSDPRTTKKAYARKAQKQSAAAPALPSLVFRAVTATGAEVWAGGSSGILYHSLDAGARWTRVAPVSGSAALSSDIVSVEFSDPQHGKITTSTAEVWTTTDDGQTWQKQ